MNSVQTEDELYKILLDDNIKLISFDCFDTLLLWPSDPSLCWKIMAQINNINEDAFLRARLDGGWWSNNKKTYSFKLPYTNDIYKKIELDIVNKLLMPRKFMRNLMHKLKLAGKEIIITCDMYMSKTDVEMLLKNHGFTEFSNIYISDGKISKRNIKLFQTIINDYKHKYSVENIIHIGDNNESDFINAKKCEIKSIRLNSPIQLYKELVSNQIFPNTLGDRLLFGFFINKIYDNPFNNFQYYKLNDLSYLLFMFMFTSVFEIKNVAQINNADVLYLVYSDGYAFNEILSVFKEFNIKLPEIKRCDLSRTIRLSKIILKYGIIDSNMIANCRINNPHIYKQLFNTNVQSQCKIIFEKKPINISKDDIMFLNQNINHKWLKQQEKYLDNYVLNMLNDKFIVFDGSSRATLKLFLKEYYNVNCKEIQLRGSIADNEHDIINLTTTNMFKYQNGIIFDIEPFFKDVNGKKLFFKSDHTFFDGHESYRFNCYMLLQLVKQHIKEFLNYSQEYINHLNFTISPFIQNILNNEFQNDGFTLTTHINYYQNKIQSILNDIPELEFLKILIGINTKMSNYMLARYYYDIKHDINQALIFLEKSINQNSNIAKKLFIEITLDHQLTQYYDLILKYINDIDIYFHNECIQYINKILSELYATLKT